MLMQHLAPAGTPIRVSDIAQWLWSLPRATEALEAFGDEFRRRFGIRHSFFVSSGRAATYLILKTLRASADPRRTHVIVPAYTCYSVPAAVIRAGLRVRILDVDPETFSYDLDGLARTDFSNVLAIVSANLYGIPNDLPALAQLANERGVYLLDDAAQSMGAFVGNRAVGTFGDVGIYSFDKGKNITSIQGGVIATNSDEMAARLAAQMATLPPPSTKYVLSMMAQLLVYAAFLHPRLYWIPGSLPFLGLGTTRYEIDYPVTRYPAALGGIAARLFHRLDKIEGRRIAIAQRYRELLANVPSVRLPRLVNGARPVYARFPLSLDSAQTKQRALDALSQAKLGATGSYPTSTFDVPEIRESLDIDASRAVAARTVAERLLTLPTHPHVNDSHIDQICSILKLST
jgi:perosamine synthetase